MDRICEIIYTVFIFGAIATAIVVLSLWASKKNCEWKGTQMEMETKFDGWGTCYLKTKNGWIPLEQYRAF